MKNKFYLNEEEKKRILQMHKSKLNQKILEEQSLQDIQNIILDNGGYVGKFGADNRLGPDTITAIYNALTKGFAKNNTATSNSSTANTLSSTASTTPSTASTTPSTASTISSTASTPSSTANTTSNTAATPTTQVKLLDRVPTNKEIRQGFRRRKKYNNRMDRQKRKQLDDLYRQYEQITGRIQKFGPSDDGSEQFKQQMATLDNQMKTINAQIDKLEA